MSAEPDYVVIRPAPGLPADSLPAQMDGMWLDRSRLPGWWAGPGQALANPTGRFEVRDDGAVAEVFEVLV